MDRYCWARRHVGRRHSGIPGRRLGDIYRHGALEGLGPRLGHPTVVRQHVNYGHRGFQEADRLEAPVVLATSVAESSTTIPWVTYVIDTGLRKTSSTKRGVTVHNVTFIDERSSTQRDGRANRTHPGKVYKLFTKAQLVEASDDADADCEGVMLFCKRAGIPIECVPSPPSANAVSRASARLCELGITDAHGRLTDDGLSRAALPIRDVQLSRFLVHAWQHGCIWEAVCIASMLSVRPLLKTDEPQIIAERVSLQQEDRGYGPGCFALLAHFFEKAWEVYGSTGALRTLCKRYGLAQSEVMRALNTGYKVHQQLSKWQPPTLQAEGGALEALRRSFGVAQATGGAMCGATTYSLGGLRVFC